MKSGWAVQVSLRVCLPSVCRAFLSFAAAAQTLDQWRASVPSRLPMHGRSKVCGANVSSRRSGRVHRRFLSTVQRQSEHTQHNTSPLHKDARAHTTHPHPPSHHKDARASVITSCLGSIMVTFRYSKHPHPPKSQARSRGIAAIGFERPSRRLHWCVAVAALVIGLGLGFLGPYIASEIEDMGESIHGDEESADNHSNR